MSDVSLALGQMAQHLYLRHQVTNVGLVGSVLAGAFIQ
jgi:hypothetical protein